MRAKAALAAGVLAGALSVAGLALRRRAAGLALAENNCAADWDAELGWAPTPAKSGLPNQWGTAVTIAPGGLRSNGEVSRRDGPVLLAVGDSFTFGDEVSDSQTWPAFLERMGPYRALNAGVCAYGVDQTYLRLKKLLPVVKPRAVVFGLIDLSISRSMVRSYPTPVGPKAKPWLKPGKEGLAVEGAPVPRGPAAPARSVWRRALFGDALPDAPPDFTGEDGVTIACAVMKELPRLAKGAKTLVLFEHHQWESADGRRRMETVRGCAREAKLEVLDLPRVPMGRPGGHPSADGNRQVAEAVARSLR